jgi:hypothetical protein
MTPIQQPPIDMAAFSIKFEHASLTEGPLKQWTLQNIGEELRDVFSSYIKERFRDNHEVDVDNLFFLIALKEAGKKIAKNMEPMTGMPFEQAYCKLWEQFVADLKNQETLILAVFQP